jgi:hypothetical protein
MADILSHDVTLLAERHHRRSNPPIGRRTSKPPTERTVPSPAGRGSNRRVKFYLRWVAVSGGRGSSIHRTAVYGPLGPVAWEGRRREASPIPILRAPAHNTSNVNFPRESSQQSFLVPISDHLIRYRCIVGMRRVHGRGARL